MKQVWSPDKALAGLYRRKSSTKEVWAVKARQRGTENVVTVRENGCSWRTIGDSLGVNSETVNVSHA